MMQELGQLLCQLCDHLNEIFGAEIRFLPGSAEGELPNDGGYSGWVRLRTEAVGMQFYVDGTYRQEIPFGVYIRMDGSDPAAHVAVLDRFGRITAALEDFSGTTAGCKLVQMPGIEKMERGSAVVYRAGYCLSSFGKGEDTKWKKTS